MRTGAVRLYWYHVPCICQQLVSELSASKVKGWPMKLGEGVPNSGGAATESTDAPASGGGGPQDLPYFHDVGKKEAEGTCMMRYYH